MGLSVETSTNNHRFLMVFPLLAAALSTPPDIWCQIVALFLFFSIIELAISVASSVQVREEGWTELRAQEVKKQEAAKRRQEMAELRQKLGFCLLSHEYLSGTELEITLDMKRAIKERLNLQN
ncbi:hypothetical protein Tco_0890703 [Tanacetum coccineum]|uniref:Uncharacterized protein n=1 Tax=Tanacetum coccineum TaxID=301880 RepID=A0ABQ5C0V3_9ASTR